jgi:hypothetical protein
MLAGFAVSVTTSDVAGLTETIAEAGVAVVPPAPLQESA